MADAFNACTVESLPADDATLACKARRVVAVAEAARAYVDYNRGCQLDELAMAELLDLVRDEAAALEALVCNKLRGGEVAHG